MADNMGEHRHDDGRDDFLSVIQPSIANLLRRSLEHFPECPQLIIEYLALVWSNRMHEARLLHPHITSHILAHYMEMQSMLAHHINGTSAYNLTADQIITLYLLLITSRFHKSTIPFPIQVESIRSIDTGIVLGKGSYGTVFDHGTCAVKLLRLDHDHASHPHLIYKIAALSALADIDSTPIAPVIYKIQVDLGLNAIAIHMTKFRYCLHEEISKSRSHALDYISVMQTLSYVMSLAHHRGIVHLDLKPGNILFDDATHLVICDWGLSRLRC